jgi:putative flippase GtrA
MLEKPITHRADNSFIQLFRYTLVGGLAFIVDFGLLFVFTDIFGIYYLISAALAFLSGLTTNYILSIVWVFNKRRLRNRSVEFGIFGLIGIVGLGFNELFIWFFTEQVHLHYLMSKIIATGFVYIWNFSVRKFMLFR